MAVVAAAINISPCTVFRRARRMHLILLLLTASVNQLNRNREPDPLSRERWQISAKRMPQTGSSRSLNGRNVRRAPTNAKTHRTTREPLSVGEAQSLARSALKGVDWVRVDFVIDFHRAAHLDPQ